MASWQSIEELPEIDQHLEKEHQEKTKVKNIQVRPPPPLLRTHRPCPAAAPCSIRTLLSPAERDCIVSKTFHSLIEAIFDLVRYPQSGDQLILWHVIRDRQGSLNTIMQRYARPCQE